MNHKAVNLHCCHPFLMHKRVFFYSKGCLQRVCFVQTTFAKKPFNLLTHRPNKAGFMVWAAGSIMQTFAYSKDNRCGTVKKMKTLYSLVVVAILNWLKPCLFSIFFPKTSFRTRFVCCDVLPVPPFHGCGITEAIMSLRTKWQVGGVTCFLYNKAKIVFLLVYSNCFSFISAGFVSPYFFQNLVISILKMLTLLR